MLEKFSVKIRFIPVCKDIIGDKLVRIVVKDIRISFLLERIEYFVSQRLYQISFEIQRRRKGRMILDDLYEYILYASFTSSSSDTNFRP